MRLWRKRQAFAKQNDCEGFAKGLPLMRLLPLKRPFGRLAAVRAFFAIIAIGLARKGICLFEAFAKWPSHGFRNAALQKEPPRFALGSNFLLAFAAARIA
jgi:hypothetical protein